MPITASQVRGQFKKFLNDKEFKKLNTLFSEVKKSKIADHEKENISILKSICRIIIYYINYYRTGNLEYSLEESIQLTALIKKLWKLNPIYKKNAFMDVLDLLFDTMMNYKEYEKVLGYSQMFVCQFTDNLPYSPDTVNHFFLSQLYKKSAEALGAKGEESTKKEFMRKSRVFEEKSKIDESKQKSNKTETQLGHMDDNTEKESIEWANKMVLSSLSLMVSQITDSKNKPDFFDKEKESIIRMQKLGQDFLKADNYEYAFKYFEQAIDMAENNPKLISLYLINLLFRGLTHVRLLKLDEAYKDFNQVVSHHSFSKLRHESNNEEITLLVEKILNEWFVVIEYNVKQKKYEQSIKDIKIYTEFSTHFTTIPGQKYHILYYLHTCHLSLKQYQQALSLIDSLATHDSSLPLWDTLRAEIYLELNDLAKAESALKEARILFKEKNIETINTFWNKDYIEEMIKKYESIFLIKKLAQLQPEIKKENDPKTSAKNPPTFFLPRPKNPIKISLNKQPTELKHKNSNKKRINTSNSDRNSISQAKKDRRAAKRKAAIEKQNYALKNKEHEEMLHAKRKQELAEKETIQGEKVVFSSDDKSIVIDMANSAVQSSENKQAQLFAQQKVSNIPQLVDNSQQITPSFSSEEKINDSLNLTIFSNPIVTSTDFYQKEVTTPAPSSPKNEEHNTFNQKFDNQITSSEETPILIQSLPEQEEKQPQEDKPLTSKEIPRYAFLRQHIMTTDEYAQFTKIMNQLDSIPAKKVKLYGSSVIAYFMASKNIIPFRNNDIDLKIYAPIEKLHEISQKLSNQGIPYAKGDVDYTQFTTKKLNQPKTERYFEITLIPEGTLEKEDFIDINQANLDVTQYKLNKHNFYYLTFNKTLSILEKAFNDKSITMDLSKTNVTGLFYRMIKSSENVKGTLQTKCILPDKKVIVMNTEWDNDDWIIWLEHYFKSLNSSDKPNTIEDDFYYKELRELVVRGLKDHYKTNTIFSVFFKKVLGPCQDLANQRILVPNLIYLFRSFFDKAATHDLKLLVASMVTLVKDKKSKWLMSPGSIDIMIRKLFENKEKTPAENKKMTPSYGKMYQPVPKRIDEETTALIPTIKRRI